MIRELLDDARSIARRDPAAKSVLEVILLYPGFHAIIFHRLAHWFYVRSLFLAARWVSQIGRFWTGIEIHPGAKIGKGLFIDHGMGIVIGETAEVGDNCTIYHCVTLGGTGKETGKRHPTIGDNVLISTGAKILGPFKVGSNSRIGANSVVLQEVEPNSTVVGVPGRSVRKDGVKLQSIELDQVHIPDPVAQELCRLRVRLEGMEARMAKLAAPGTGIGAGVGGNVGVDVGADVGAGGSIAGDADKTGKKVCHMKLYNTLTRQKEDFVPLEEGKAGVYSCGPTVYDYAHIGNLRTYIFVDILRRVLQYEGYKLFHVMNITDVGHLVSDADAGEDKLNKAAKERRLDPWEIARFYTEAFVRDTAKLNIQSPEIISKATEHIPEMISFVEGLVDKGFAYEISDGIYFDISRFAGYGKLSRLDLEQQIAGARVEVNEEKRNPSDFALWKKAPKEHVMQWQSPWGMGFPGWHIECSAMARKYLGDLFDIHTGGVDHIPVHHENEIAQSEALLGKPAVNTWMHAEFLLVDGGKMSKSLQNAYTVTDLESRRFNPLAFRYLCLNAHYRSKSNFTWEGLAAAQKSLERFYEGVFSLKGGTESISPEVLESFRKEFDEAVTDDLNIPKALGTAWNMVRYGRKSHKLYEMLVGFDAIFGLGLAKYEPKASYEGLSELPAEVSELIDQRRKARQDKDYKLADELRHKLDALGYALEDTPQGPKIYKR